MDRRHFIEASSALALSCLPIRKAISQTTWSPPYALPSAGQVISLTVTGGNVLKDVATADNGWGAYWWPQIGSAIWNGYGYGALAPDYSTAGAMVIAGIGGHHAGGIWGGFIFDFTTGKWISKANANGKAEVPYDPESSEVDWSTAELINKTGLTGQLPVPAHGYTWHFCPGKQVGGGTRGYLIKTLVAAAAQSGNDGSRSFKFDLDTGLWTYAADNFPNFDGVSQWELLPYTDGGGAWDEQAQRFYSTLDLDSGNIRFLEKSATSQYGWTWKKAGCPNHPGARFGSLMVDRRTLIAFAMDGRVWTANLDNLAAGWTPRTISGAMPTGYWYNRWHKWPSADGGDDCYYTMRGKGQIGSYPANHCNAPNSLAIEQFLYKLNPATWTASTVPISGGILAMFEYLYSESNGGSAPHGNGFIYVPALKCFAWFPRPDAPVQLIRPSTDGSSGGGDTQPPTVPATLRVKAVTASSIEWAWNAATDNGGGSVAGYKVVLYDARDAQLGAAVDVGNRLAYLAKDLIAGATYKLRVGAYDNAAPANESPLSAPVAGTTKKKDPPGKNRG